MHSVTKIDSEVLSIAWKGILTPVLHSINTGTFFKKLTYINLNDSKTLFHATIEQERCQ